MKRPWIEVLEDLSLNHLEYKILRRGHYLRRLLERDKGIDARMEHYAADRTIDNGEVRFQLKARRELRTVRNGTAIACRVETRHLHHWSLELYPVVLIVYDGSRSGRSGSTFSPTWRRTRSWQKRKVEP
jgi:hypothetical protein